jgi:rhodanese-related sulfurtransferase
MTMTVTRISPIEAHDKMTREGYAYVDVRTPEEFAAGRPAGAINIPIGDGFVEAVLSRFAKDAPLVLGCRTGNRSLRAANMLLAAGFTRVLEQRAGFDGARGPFGEISEPGRKQQGLPTE